MQLSPTVISNNPILKKSLFDDIITKRPEAAIMLNIQYRMHPEISLFPSQVFYDNRIQDGVKASDRKSPYPLFEEGPVVLINNPKEEVKVGNSYTNFNEAETIKNLICETFDNNDFKNIGVITAFAPQQDLLSN